MTSGVAHTHTSAFFFILVFSSLLAQNTCLFPPVPEHLSRLLHVVIAILFDCTMMLLALLPVVRGVACGRRRRYCAAAAAAAAMAVTDAVAPAAAADNEERRTDGALGRIRRDEPAAAA